MDQVKVIGIKRSIFVLLSVFALATSLGCSEQKFSTVKSKENRCDAANPNKSCRLSCNDDGTLCKRDYDYQVGVETSIADILFVVDNSGSMSPEQREMGSKFPSFLQSISGLDYRVAVTTTDISDPIENPPGPYNGYGNWQDGRLINFEPGRSYLDGSLSNGAEQNLFNQTVSRDETEVCEDNNYDFNFCPSGDERGILAAYMTILNNYNSFLRDSGHLAVVILSDEDERSEGDSSNYPFESVEYPNNFKEAVKLQYPNKTLAVHSIVIQPGDDTCLNAQSVPGTPRGFFGTTYAELSYVTNGIVGSICSNNYSNLLADIGDEVAIPREALPCRPDNDQIEVSFIPEPPYTVDVHTDFERQEVSFSRALPKGTKIRFQFSCAHN